MSSTEDLEQKISKLEAEVSSAYTSVRAHALRLDTVSDSFLGRIAVSKYSGLILFTSVFAILSLGFLLGRMV